MYAELAKQMQTLLTVNGFRARIRGAEKEGFHVALYDIEMLTKWTAEIGFSNPKTRQQSQIQKPLKHFTSFLDVSLPAHGAEVAQPGRALG